MANSYQSLLDTPKKRTGFKFLYVILFLVVTILGVIAIVSITILKSSPTVSSSSSLRTHLCSKAHDPSCCLAVVSEITSPGLMQSSDVELLQMLLAKSSSLIQETIELTSNINRRINDQKGQAAQVDCLELMDISMVRLVDSMMALGSQTIHSHSDVHTWLSSVLTNHVTCLDGLNGPARHALEAPIEGLILRARTSLAMLVAMAPPKEEMIQVLDGDFPSWITRKDRLLLQSSAKNINANVVVAQDGSGNYKTVQEAVTAAPNNAQTRYVIYVKKGTYEEHVDIVKSKKNLMLVGDGMDLTIITGSLNVVDGSTTFQSATVGKILPFKLNITTIYLLFFLV